ncbi:MAG TPA: DNA repair protein RecN [Gemmatimonadaceae bacterium]|nr:DNA repair protein RecN [Gemmatimonadaceae bacterium]
MLTELRVRNFAIIEQLALPLARGFNVLTGETGAGKSIIVGALGLLLGERANTDVVRTGADKAIVEGTFDVTDRPELTALLDERGIDVEEQTVVLKREVAAAGRARAWVNGTPVTAAVLSEIGRLLVNVHGQHEAQTLLDPDEQRDILDAFAGAQQQVAAVRSAHGTLVSVRNEITELRRRKADAERRADYLRHVVREIEDARLVDGEDVRLDEEARRLEHAEELRSLASGAATGLDGDDDAVLTHLGAVQRAIASIARIDPAQSRMQELFDTGYYALEELARELEEYEAGVDLDPARLGEVRTRRELVFRLMKKYGSTLAEVIETGAKARGELDLVESADLDLRSLEAREREAESLLRDSAAELTKLRRAASSRLGHAVDEVLPSLGMSDGHFAAVLVPLPDIGACGAEGVEFRVALNVGHDARPLSRVASGGELSRVMLALKTILARLDQVPTLIFDEVDAGIGGKVGLQVGDTMRRVAAHHQVFAITHLPQIAARAHHHILVAKGARGGVTTADVAVLVAEQRITEIARMLGGDPESDISRAHASELLEAAVVIEPEPRRDAPPKRARKQAGDGGALGAGR